MSFIKEVLGASLPPQNLEDIITHFNAINEITIPNGIKFAIYKHSVNIPTECKGKPVETEVTVLTNSPENPFSESRGTNLVLLRAICDFQNSLNRFTLRSGNCESVSRKAVNAVSAEGTKLADGYFWGDGVNFALYGYNDHAVNYKYVPDINGRNFDLLMYDLTSGSTIGKGTGKFKLVVFYISARDNSTQTDTAGTALLSKIYGGSWVESAQKFAYGKSGKS